MAYAFVGAVIHIYKEWLPIFRQGVVIYGISVVLGCYETFCGTHLLYWLVVRAVTILQFVCFCSCSTGKQLVTQTYSHAWA